LRIIIKGERLNGEQLKIIYIDKTTYKNLELLRFFLISFIKKCNM